MRNERKPLTKAQSEDQGTFKKLVQIMAINVSTNVESERNENAGRKKSTTAAR